MIDRQALAKFPVVSISVKLTMSVLIAAGVATVVLLLSGNSRFVVVTMITGGVCLFAAMSALLPVWLMSGSSPIGAAQGFIVGLLIRMILCLVAAFGLIVGTSFEMMPVCVSMVLWYLSLLSVEVFLISRYLYGRQDTQG